MFQFGVVTHEIGHALGFWHEQSRYDRGPFLELFLQNVLPADLSNFDLETQMNLYNVPYDYGMKSLPAPRLAQC
jgi:astacin